MSSGPRRRRGGQGTQLQQELLQQLLCNWAVGAEQLVYHADADGLQESLLGADYSSSSGPAIVPRPHQQQLIVHQPFSVDVFIRFVVDSWLAFLSKCNKLQHVDLPIVRTACSCCSAICTFLSHREQLNQAGIQ
jgi:hypothetical protein